MLKMPVWLLITALWLLCLLFLLLQFIELAEFGLVRHHGGVWRQHLPGHPPTEWTCNGHCSFALHLQSFRCEESPELVCNSSKLRASPQQESWTVFHECVCVFNIFKSIYINIASSIATSKIWKYSCVSWRTSKHSCLFWPLHSEIQSLEEKEIRC